MNATIHNNFHGTSCTVKVGDDGILSAGQAKKVGKTLCGIDGCTCGGELSERGRQEVRIEVTGRWNGNRPEVRIAAKEEAAAY